MQLHSSTRSRLTHRNSHRATLAAFAVSLVAVYACADVGRGVSPRGLRVPTPSPDMRVTPGVVTLCKVGSDAKFDVQVGSNAPVNTVALSIGACTQITSVPPTQRDDVIVTITERTSNDYSLDHINVNDGTANPAQDVTGTRTVTFEAMHGAIITYYNNALINVCKQGTSATFQYQVGVSNAYQPLSLANGECRLIATIPPTNKDDVIVTVRENSSTSYTFDHAVLQQGNTAPQTFTVPTVGGFEGAHGATITFYNTPVVSFGCTYTQGYYKNKGKGLLPSGNFYKSGQTYLQVLETAPKGGNAYYILAHQYIAASINAKTASVPTSVQAALTASAIYFATATPSNPYFGIYTQSYLTSLADILDQYNSGQLGPGHCGGEDGEE